MVEQPEVPMIDVATKPKTETVDEKLFAEAQRQLPTLSSSDLINEGLRRIVEDGRERRRSARERLHKMHADGLFDYSALEAAEE
jgi:Arc/MetJ family transcription regulator